MRTEDPPARSQAAGPGLAQLTPLENALLADFAARVRRLTGTRLARISVFGSRARGDSRADSDLDVAVFVAGGEDRALRAVFHAAEALLYAKGIEAASHKAVASMLAMHFVRPGALPRDTSAKFSALMAGRHDADHNEAIPFGLEDARAAAATGHTLLADLLGVLDGVE